MTYGGPGSGHPGGPSPWADPTTPTEPGSPYLGPPPTTPAGPYGYPPQVGYPAPYGYPGQGRPGYGYPGQWGPVPPPRPQRPGTVVASAVLAFVQAGLVLIVSLYVWFLARVVNVFTADGQAVFGPGTSRIQSLTTELTVLAVLQVISAVLLVVAGFRLFGVRTRTAWLLAVAAHAVQIVLALYWVVRLAPAMNPEPTGGPEGTTVVAAIVFAAGPVAGLALLVAGSGRRWFESPPSP